MIFLFALGNASDAFLLLRLSDIGIDDFWIPLLWSGLHVVKVGSRRCSAGKCRTGSAAATPSRSAGCSTRPSTRRLRSSTRGAWLIAIFLAYGIYFGFTEGVEKAWIADLAPLPLRGTAFGYYNAVDRRRRAARRAWCSA